MAKYSASLVKELIAELEKVPLIRQACSKTDIDHSTFYRWMVRHPAFRKKVEDALFIGRKNVTDAAESVIFQGIQRGEYRHAVYFLSHNERRYMSSRQGEYYRELIDSTIGNIQDHLADTRAARFEKLFKYCESIEHAYEEPELRERLIDPVIELYCDNDPKLMSVFRRVYEEWKKDQQTFADSARRAGFDFDQDGKLIVPREE